MRIFRISLFLMAGAALGPVRVSAQYCNHKCPVELKDETGCCPEAAKPKLKPKAKPARRAKPAAAIPTSATSATAPVLHCKYGQAPKSCGTDQAVDDGGCCPPPAVPASVAPVPIRTAGASETDSHGIAWVNIPAGSFQMGCVPGDSSCESNEKPRHQVSISRFKMMKNPAMVAQFKAYAQATGITLQSQPDWNGEDHPVVNVNWDEAKSFCEWAGGRLPTEAEWEYAARGGKEGTVYPWGNEASHEYANYLETEGRDTWTNTSPVGSFPANGFGLYDMAGNVWEWVADWYDTGYYANSPSTDPKGPGSGGSRVWRGGGWGVFPGGIRSSFRIFFVPGVRYIGTGFRCIRD